MNQQIESRVWYWVMMRVGNRIDAIPHTMVRTQIHPIWQRVQSMVLPKSQGRAGHRLFEEIRR